VVSFFKLLFNFHAFHAEPEKRIERGDGYQQQEHRNYYFVVREAVIITGLRYLDVWFYRTYDGDMAIKVIKESVPKSELAAIAEQQFGNLVKAVVDVRQGIMAIGGELHADELVT
jgi:hypothetical protein